MKILRQIVLLLFLVFIGEILNKVFKVPIPGNILGMILLLLALLTGIIKLDQIEEISQFLLNHLSVLFVPAGVGLLAVTGLLKGSWYFLVLISILATILVLSTTGLVVRLLRRWIG